MIASELKPGQRFRIRIAGDTRERMVFIALDRERICGWLVTDICGDMGQTIIPHGRFRFMAPDDCMAVHAESWVLAGIAGDATVELTEGS